MSAALARAPSVQAARRLFSRQRYWASHPGDPTRRRSVKLVRESDCRCVPELDDFKPRRLESPPARVRAWVGDRRSRDRAPRAARQRTHAAVGGSCWYTCASPIRRTTRRVLARGGALLENIDLYVGGAEHAVSHSSTRASGTRCCSTRARAHQEPFRSCQPRMIRARATGSSARKARAPKYYTRADVRYEGETP